MFYTPQKKSQPQPISIPMPMPIRITTIPKNKYNMFTNIQNPTKCISCK